MCIHILLTCAKMFVIGATIVQLNTSVITITRQLARVDRMIGKHFLSHAFAISMLTAKSGCRTEVGRADNFQNAHKTIQGNYRRKYQLSHFLLTAL